MAHFILKTVKLFWSESWDEWSRTIDIDGSWLRETICRPDIQIRYTCGEQMY